MGNILWIRASLWSRLLRLPPACSPRRSSRWCRSCGPLSIRSRRSAETFQLGAFIPFLEFQPTLDSWRDVLSDPQTTNAFINSCVISAGTTVFALILGVPAAYSLARYEFRRMKSNDITLWFLSQRVLPPAVVLVPFYLLLVYLRLIDTWTGLILCNSTFNLAFVVVIMRDIFRDVAPRSRTRPRSRGRRPGRSSG